MTEQSTPDDWEGDEEAVNEEKDGLRLKPLGHSHLMIGKAMRRL